MGGFDLVDQRRLHSLSMCHHVCSVAMRTTAKLMRDRAAGMRAIAVATRARMSRTRKAIAVSLRPPSSDHALLSEAAETLFIALRRESPLCLPCAGKRIGRNRWEVKKALLELITARTALATPTGQCAACHRTILVARLMRGF